VTAGATDHCARAADAPKPTSSWTFSKTRRELSLSCGRARHNPGALRTSCTISGWPVRPDRRASYSRGVDPHRLAEERSLALHRVVAERLRSDPRVLRRARDKVQCWQASGQSPHYARAWLRLLAGPLEPLCELLVADTEEARALRQATPFAGAVSPQERWCIWAQTREALATR
jgi:hypothetical protein